MVAGAGRRHLHFGRGQKEIEEGEGRKGKLVGLMEECKATGRSCHNVRYVSKPEALPGDLSVKSSSATSLETGERTVRRKSNTLRKRGEETALERTSSMELRSG